MLYKHQVVQQLFKKLGVILFVVTISFSYLSCKKELVENQLTAQTLLSVSTAKHFFTESVSTRTEGEREYKRFQNILRSIDWEKYTLISTPEGDALAFSMSISSIKYSKKIKGDRKIVFYLEAGKINYRFLESYSFNSTSSENRIVDQIKKEYRSIFHDKISYLNIDGYTLLYNYNANYEASSLSKVSRSRFYSAQLKSVEKTKSGSFQFTPIDSEQLGQCITYDVYFVYYDYSGAIVSETFLYSYQTGNCEPANYESVPPAPDGSNTVIQTYVPEIVWPLCASSISLTSESSGSYYSTNLRGLRFVGPNEAINSFDIYAGASNNILKSNIDRVTHNPYLDAIDDDRSAMDRLLFFPPTRELVLSGEIELRTLPNGERVYQYSTYAIKEIMKFSANLVAAGIVAQFGINASNPQYLSIIKSAYAKDFEDVLKGLIPGSRASATTRNGVIDSYVAYSTPQNPCH